MKASPISFVGLLLLLGMASPSQAAERLVGGYSEASVTNTEVVAAAQFAVNASLKGLIPSAIRDGPKDNS